MWRAILTKENQELVVRIGCEVEKKIEEGVCEEGVCEDVLKRRELWEGPWQPRVGMQVGVFKYVR